MQGKVTLNDSAAAQVYAGIDVCKKWLDIAITPHGHCERFENTGKGFKKLIRWLASYDVALVLMEATGKLHRKAHAALHNAGLPVCVVNPLRSRLFAEADRIDAKCLAAMAASLQPAPGRADAGTDGNPSGTLASPPGCGRRADCASQPDRRLGLDVRQARIRPPADGCRGQYRTH